MTTQIDQVKAVYVIALCTLYALTCFLRDTGGIHQIG